MRRSQQGLGKVCEVWGGSLFFSPPFSPHLFLPCCLLPPARRDYKTQRQDQDEVPQEGPGESGFLLLLVLRMGLQTKVAAAVAVVGLP